MKARSDRQKRQRRGPGGSGPLDEQALVARVAAFLAERNRHQSLRVLAEEIDVSKSTVDALVQAHHRLRPMPEPHKTWPRLRNWYLQEKLVTAGGLRDPVDMALVTQEILADVPEANLRPATVDLLASIGEIHDRYGAPRPSWLRRLADPGASEPSLPPE